MNHPVNRITRWLVAITFINVIIHALLSHNEDEKIITALTQHQAHSIAAFAEVTTLIAKNIGQRQEARDALSESVASTPYPTPSPVIITRTRTRTKIVRPTPKPFHFFGPN